MEKCRFDEAKGFICNRDVDLYAQTFLADCTVVCENLGAQIPLRCKGQAISPGLGTSPEAVYFGECDVGDRRDVVVTLSNKNKHAPLDWRALPTAHVRIEPEQGKLSPMQSMDVLLTFQPKVS